MRSLHFLATGKSWAQDYLRQKHFIVFQSEEGIVLNYTGEKSPHSFKHDKIYSTLFILPRRLRLQPRAKISQERIPLPQATDVDAKSRILEPGEHDAHIIQHVP